MCPEWGLWLLLRSSPLLAVYVQDGTRLACLIRGAALLCCSGMRARGGWLVACSPLEDCGPIGRAVLPRSPTSLFITIAAIRIIGHCLIQRRGLRVPATLLLLPRGLRLVIPVVGGVRHGLVQG